MYVTIMPICEQKLYLWYILKYKYENKTGADKLKKLKKIGAIGWNSTDATLP